MRPFFTVIIPTLNEQEYLPNLLRSLVHQSYRQFEVIIVDGTSTDKTVALAARFASRLPKLTIVTSKKQNVSYQRNRGARMGKGTYYVFLDADVTVPPEYLTTLRATIHKKHSQLLTTWHTSDTKEPMDEFLNSVANVMMELAKIFDKPFAGGFNTVVDRSVFKKIKGYDEHLKFAEDHDFILRCGEAGHELVILRDVKITFCMRRFRHYGYFKMISTYAATSLHALINKTIVDEPFEYPMGGQVYKKRFKIPDVRFKNKDRFKNIFRTKIN